MSDIVHHFYEVTDSTNTRAREHLTDGSIILAEQQTNGRGRYGRDWISPKGNLYMSLVWKVKNLEIAGKYAFLCALALADTIEQAYGLKGELSLKWPNDLLFKKKKLAGILLEAEQKDEETYLIIGIGVNLFSSPDYAINLKSFSNTEKTPKEISTGFALNLKKVEEVFEKNGFSDIRLRWIEKAHGLGRLIKVRLAKEEIHGIFETIDENGALVLSLKNGSLKYITSGEVFF